MDVVWAVVGLLAVIHVGYALWTARRLDRLHRRVDAAAAALDRQLRVRAQVAAAAAGRGREPGPELADGAAGALAVAGLGPEREQAENALSRAVVLTAERAELDEALVVAVARATYARALHNDAVRDALVVRRRRIVRAFRLAGSARMPTFFEMDDAAVARRTIEV